MKYYKVSDDGEMMSLSGDMLGMICETPGCHRNAYQGGHFCWACLHGERPTSGTERENNDD